MIWGRFMGWLLGHRQDAEQATRVDAVLARGLVARERTAQAAGEAVEAASASRRRTEVARDEIRERVRNRSRESTQTAGVREMVEDMMRVVNEQQENGGDRP